MYSKIGLNKGNLMVADISFESIQYLGELVQPLIALLCFAIGLGVKMVLKRLSAFDRKIDELRLEFHEEMKEFQRKEICASHREYINKRIDMMIQDKMKIFSTDNEPGGKKKQHKDDDVEEENEDVYRI